MANANNLHDRGRNWLRTVEQQIADRNAHDNAQFLVELKTKILELSTTNPVVAMAFRIHGDDLEACLMHAVVALARETELLRGELRKATQ